MLSFSTPSPDHQAADTRGAWWPTPQDLQQGPGLHPAKGSLPSGAREDSVDEEAIVDSISDAADTSTLSILATPAPEIWDEKDSVS